MNIEETNKVLWKYSKKKATYELQKEKGLSFNDDDYEASVICDYLLELVAYNNYQKEEIERLNKQVNRLNNAMGNLKKYICSIEDVQCRWFEYDAFMKYHLIDYETLRKKVEEDGSLEGHFIEINLDKVMKILDKVGVDKE